MTRMERECLPVRRFIGLRWHVPLLYLVGILTFASIYTAHDDPGFLGPYLLLLGEFLAGGFYSGTAMVAGGCRILQWLRQLFAGHSSCW